MEDFAELVTFCYLWRFVTGDILWDDILSLVTLYEVTFCRDTKNIFHIKYTEKGQKLCSWKYGVLNLSG
jgi:hypothetical protein